MVIENLTPKLPKKEKTAERFFLSCERRKKIIADTEGHYVQRLEKAKHDLARASAEFKDGCWDWTIIKAYYAIHHAANALLSKKKNVFSKDHSCLIVSLQHYNLIPKDIFNDLSKVHEKFSDIFSLDITFQLRKIGQYGVDEWKNIGEKDAKMIMDVATKFVRFAEENL